MIRTLRHGRCLLEKFALPGDTMTAEAEGRIGPRPRPHDREAIPVSPPDPFPTDFDAARSRFRVAADRAGARPRSWPVGPEGEGLTIDLARVGPEDAPGLVVVSGGLHGVEGPLGSAVQSSWLEGDGPGSLPSGVAVLLIHAINPFGFRHSRRFDAANIDLNRNFLPPGESYRGHHPTYARLDPLLNPPRPPGRFEAIRFTPRAIATSLRLGADAVKQAIAEGQYDFPRGLFFGGPGPSEASLLLHRHLPDLIGPARSVVHLDFHTGLGPKGTSTLLVDDPPGAPSTLRLVATFGPGRVEPWAPGGTAYRARGTFDSWCARRFGIDGRIYDAACAEFGTYPGRRVLAALRRENMATHHCPPGSPALIRARAILSEAFIPADPSWRRWARLEGLRLVDLAVSRGCRGSDPMQSLGDEEQRPGA
jgi:hypothetical protein